MRTNIEIDDELMASAMAETGCRTKKETVELALRELLRLQAQRRLLELDGNFEWEGDLDEMREGRFVDWGAEPPAR